MLRSPIYYDKALRSHIDLSQLAQVGDPVGWRLYENGVHERNIYDPSYYVGFDYRFNNSGEPVRYRRPLREGPVRWEDLSLVHPNQQLDTIGEEIFKIVRPHPKYGAHSTEHCGWVVTHSEKTQEMTVLRNLRAERKRLVNAWTKWKAIEPEIYAIIRKHLS